MKFLALIFFQAQIITFDLVQTAKPPLLPGYSRALEMALRIEMFERRNYSELQRPVSQVHTEVSFTLLTVNELNIKDQFLSISGYLTFRWTDDRLTWGNTSTTREYKPVLFLFSSENYVWTPTLIIENSIDDISILKGTKSPIRIRQDGQISWDLSGIFKVSCQSDITYYPLDSQTCIIKVSTWGYTHREIDLHLDKIKPIILDFYGENGEWDLYSANGQKSDNQMRGGMSFSIVYFDITLRRKPLFHLINTVFPMILMTFLIPMVFKLPADSGERMGYSLTVLLAYAVYLTIITDNIPSTSKNVCYLSIYLEMTMAFSTVCVNMVIFTLHAYSQGEKEVSNYIRSITRKVCFYRRMKNADQNKIVPSSDRENDINVQRASVNGSAISNYEKLTYREFSEILDKAFFVIFLTAISVSTLALLMKLFLHYYNN